MEGNCKRAKKCTGAHGEEERTAWNEHLKMMEKEIQKETEEESKQQKDHDSPRKIKDTSSLTKKVRT